jgi:AbrB family looped-hinge helix DNA binding protein
MKIGERGQITIPKKLRDKYGLLPNIEIEFVPENAGVRLQKRARHTSPVKAVFGILNKHRKTDEHIEAIRGR